MTTHEFAVEPRLRLILTDVSAVVRVRRGEPGAASVDVSGAEAYADTLEITYDAATNVLDVREEPPVDVVTVAGGGVVIGAGPTVVHNVRTRGRTTVATGSGSVVSGGSVGSVVTGGGVVGGAGVTVVNAGGRIVVNGVDVTEQVAAQRPEPPPVVTVVVPHGTDIGAERCLDLTSAEVGGRVRARVAGQGRLSASGVTAARLTVTGQSEAALHRSGGSLGLTVTGQSQVRLDGAFDDVDLEVTGQSRVVGGGSFGQVSGKATGMARVELSGSAAGQSVTTSGMAKVRIGGSAPGGAAAGDDWDF